MTREHTDVELTAETQNAQVEGENRAEYQSEADKVDGLECRIGPHGFAHGGPRRDGDEQRRAGDGQYPRGQCGKGEGFHAVEKVSIPLTGHCGA